MENKNKKQCGGDSVEKKQTRFNKHIHPVTSWVSVAAVSLSSFLIISAVLAQTGTINQPFEPVPGAAYDQNIPPGNVPIYRSWRDICSRGRWVPPGAGSTGIRHSANVR